MDTLKEKNMLEEIWDSGNVPWKVWDDDARAKSHLAIV
jgi:glucose-1-phosphate cytidylyltransferase